MTVDSDKITERRSKALQAKQVLRVIISKGSTTFSAAESMKNMQTAVQWVFKLLPVLVFEDITNTRRKGYRSSNVFTNAMSPNNSVKFVNIDVMSHAWRTYYPVNPFDPSVMQLTVSPTMVWAMRLNSPSQRCNFRFARAPFIVILSPSFKVNETNR